MLMSKCDKCAPEDHDGFFCRCEMRNIEVAKELRKNDQSPWKRSQLPHAKLTEEEIKKAVCEIVYDLQELRETCTERHNMIAEQIDEIDTKLYWLKRHFCPDKFEEMQVPINYLQEMVEKAYGDMNVGEPNKLTRYADDPTA